MKMFQEKYNEQQLQVLILADQFTPELDYLKLDEASWAFKRFHIFQFIDLCLEWVTWLESPRVIVAFANQPDKIAQQLQQKWVKNFMDLQVLTFQKCHSANDVLREIETRGLLSGDFLLVYNCATFCSSNLTTQIKNFRILKRQNKNSVATLLFTEQSDAEMQNSGPLVAFESSSKKIVHFDPHSHRRGKVRMPKTAFLVGTSFRSDLAPCGLMLCTAEFRCHFAGNYDFHSLDAILQDILSNEEFLGQQFHLDIVDDQQALCIRNVPAIFDVHAKLLQRKCFPLSFDNVFPNLKASNDIDHLELCSKERNIYSPAGAFSEDKLQNEKLQDVVFGRNCQLGSGSTIERVSFEINAKIGSDILLQDVICGKGVQIGDGVKIESSILGNNVTIGSGAVLGRNCLLGDGVEVAFLVIYCIGMNGAKAKVFAGTTVGSGTFLQRGKTPSKWMAIEEDRGEVSSEEEEDETGERERAKETEPVDVTYQGNSRAFISEVLESMQAIQEATSESRGEKDDQVSAKKFSISGEQVEHLKLEINASKLAYNISLEELPRLLFLAFLRLLGPDHRLSAFTEMFKGWSPLWDVFFKKAATKMGMLHAIEEFAGENAPFRRIVPNVLHWLSQDQEFLDDDQILTWHTALPSDSPLHDLPKLTELIEWLQQEEEESE